MESEYYDVPSAAIDAAVEAVYAGTDWTPAFIDSTAASRLERQSGVGDFDISALSPDNNSAQEAFRKSEIIKQNASEEPSGNSALDSILGAVDKAGSFVQKNSKLFELGSGLIGGAYAAQEKRDAAAATTAAQIAAEERAAAAKAATLKRIGDSIIAMKKPTMGKQVPLTRIDGSRVYNNERSL